MKFNIKGINRKVVVAICLTATSLYLTGCTSNNQKSENTHEHENMESEPHDHIFACPMHPEVVGLEGEKCSKCGMALEHMDDMPVSGNYQMEFHSIPENIEAGKEAILSFKPKNKDNSSLSIPLDVEHEKKIHLIVVSEDLSWFNHIHPEYQVDGSYTVPETFPNGGNYFLYADYKPSGSTHQLNKINVSVSGNAIAPRPFTQIKSTANDKIYSVTLKPDDASFISNKAIHFDGVFTKNGESFDVNNLQNYLGAKGHMVAINTDTKEYMHLHPEVEGTILHFHTTFEKAGVYRIWLQFMDEGELYTLDFVIRVEQGDTTDQTVNSHNNSENSY